MTETLNQRGFVNVSVSSAGVPTRLSDFLPSGSRWHHVLIGVSGGPIRWLAIPGQAPSPTYGSYIGAGGSIDWTHPDTDYAGMIYNAQFVKAGGTDANLEVSLFW